LRAGGTPVSPRREVRDHGQTLTDGGYRPPSAGRHTSRSQSMRCAPGHAILTSASIS